MHRGRRSAAMAECLLRTARTCALCRQREGAVGGWGRQRGPRWAHPRRCRRSQRRHLGCPRRGAAVRPCTSLLGSAEGGTAATLRCVLVTRCPASEGTASAPAVWCVCPGGELCGAAAPVRHCKSAAESCGSAGWLLFFNKFHTLLSQLHTSSPQSGASGFYSSSVCSLTLRSSSRQKHI